MPSQKFFSAPILSLAATVAIAGPAFAQDEAAPDTEMASEVHDAESIALETGLADEISEAVEASVGLEEAVVPIQDNTDADAQAEAIAQGGVMVPVRARVMTELTKPASLLEFDGAAAVLKKAARRRIVLPSLGYKLTVGADGQPTSCEVTDNYRQKFTRIVLCKTLMSHHSFEPARDAQGKPVEGSYENRLYYRQLREETQR